MGPVDKAVVYCFAFGARLQTKPENRRHSHKPRRLEIQNLEDMRWEEQRQKEAHLLALPACLVSQIPGSTHCHHACVTSDEHGTRAVTMAAATAEDIADDPAFVSPRGGGRLGKVRTGRPSTSPNKHGEDKKPEKRVPVGCGCWEQTRMISDAWLCCRHADRGLPGPARGRRAPRHG